MSKLKVHMILPRIDLRLIVVNQIRIVKRLVMSLNTVQSDQTNQYNIALKQQRW